MLDRALTLATSRQNTSAFALAYLTQARALLHLAEGQLDDALTLRTQGHRVRRPELLPARAGRGAVRARPGAGGLSGDREKGVGKSQARSGVIVGGSALTESAERIGSAQRAELDILRDFLRIGSFESKCAERPNVL